MILYYDKIAAWKSEGQDECYTGTFEDFLTAMSGTVHCNLPLCLKPLLLWIKSQKAVYTDSPTLKRGQYTWVIGDNNVCYLLKAQIGGHPYRFQNYLPKMSDAWINSAPKAEIDALRHFSKPLEYFITKGFTGLTWASDSLQKYKEFITPRLWGYFFPQLSRKQDEFVRNSVRAGIAGGRFGESFKQHVYIYDLNSHYIDRLRCPMPFGKPIIKAGAPQPTEQYPLYIAEIDFCGKLLPDGIPCIYLKNRQWQKTETYLTDTLGCLEKLFLTSIDLKLLLENYEVQDIKYKRVYYFRASSKLFGDFVNPLYEQKRKAYGIERDIWKGLLVGFVGKFAASPIHVDKRPDIDFKALYTVHDKILGKTIYAPVTAFCNAYGRYKHVTALRKHRNSLIYYDTDSMHLLEPATDLDIGDGLGQWKEEYPENTGASYKAVKHYTLNLPNATVVKAAGTPLRDRK